MKTELRKQRLAILKEETALIKRDEAGEDVAALLLNCGKQLDKLANKTRRANVLDADYFGAPELVKDKRHNEITKELIERAASNGISYSALKCLFSAD